MQKPEQNSCVFVNVPDGRQQHFKRELERQGWQVTVLECGTWREAFSEVGTFCRELRKSHFVILDTHFPVLLPWLLLARFFRKKVVLDYPVDVTLEYFIQRVWWKAMQKWAARQADFVLTLQSRSYVVEKFKLDPAKVLFLENCPDLEHIERGRSAAPRFRFPQGSIGICYSGVSPWQRIDRFVETFKALRVRLPNVHWLVLSFADEPAIRRLRAKAEAQGVLDAMTFHPVIKPYEDFVATVNQCALWLSHFDDESTLGRTELRTELLELGALGKPAAAVRTPALELHDFRDGENIIFLDPNDPESSAARLAGLLKNSGQLQRIGLGLQRHVLGRFSLEKSVERIVAAIRNGKADRPAPVSLFETTRCLLCGSNENEPALTLKDRMLGGHEVFHMVKCRACGLFYLSPRPTRAAIQRYYPEHYYSYTRSAPVGVNKDFAGWRGWVKRQMFEPGSLLGHFFKAWFVAWDSNWRWFYAANPANRGKRMLEIGCGAGQTLLFFREFGWIVEGVEMSEASAAAGRAAGLKITAGEISETGFDRGAFDLVWMSHVLEHLHDPRAALKSLGPLLAPGGRIVLEVPVADAFLPRVLGPFSPVWDAPRHLVTFTESTLSRLADDCGFTLQRLTRSCTKESLIVGLSYFGEERFPRVLRAFQRMPGVVKKILSLPICFLAGLLQFVNTGDALVVELRPKESV